MKSLLSLWITGCVSAACWQPVVCQAQRGSSGYIPQLYQGQSALKAKKWSSAASHFRYALEWNHNGIDAHLGIAEVYLATGQPKRALEEFRVVLRMNPHSAEAERGIHQARSADEEEAAFQAIAAQVKQEPDNADAHTTYAEELVERDRLEEAQREAETALRLDPRQGHAYCALGRVAARQGKDDEARKNLEIAIKRDSTDDDAFATLGDLAMKAKAYRQAVTYYSREVAIVPDESEGHKKLLAALTALGDTARAEKERLLLERLESSQPK